MLSQIQDFVNWVRRLPVIFTPGEFQKKSQDKRSPSTIKAKKAAPEPARSSAAHMPWRDL